MAVDEEAKLDERYKLHLGKPHTGLPLNTADGLVASDPLVKSVIEAASSGDSTRKYYDHLEGLSSLFAGLGRPKGHEKAIPLSKGVDEKNGQDVYYANKIDGEGKSYYLTVKFEGLVTDEDGNVVLDGKQVTINGTKYQAVGMVTQTVGYDNLTFSQASRWAGTTALGLIPLKAIMPWVTKALASVASVLGNAFRSLFSRLGSLVSGAGSAVRSTALSVAEGTEIELAETGAVETIAEAAAVETGETVAEGVMLGGLSVTFFGVCLVFAAIFFAAYWALHNSFHQLRIYNFTKYTMEWAYHIDEVTIFNFCEGKLVEGPGRIGKDDTIVPGPISGAKPGPGIPGVRGTAEVYYADLSVVSSHEFTGIGYALQLQLKDPGSSKTVHTVTAYYDIPWGSPVGHAGDNSTDLTFKDVSDLGKWYKDNAGWNKSKAAHAASDDARFEARSTFDYLSGKHGMSSLFGAPTNEAYVYRSVLYVLDKELKVSDL